MTVEVEEEEEEEENPMENAEERKRNSISFGIVPLRFLGAFCYDLGSNFSGHYFIL